MNELNGGEMGFLLEKNLVFLFSLYAGGQKISSEQIKLLYNS